MVSAEEEAQPPRLSRELTKGQESSGKEACRQFHAVMKNAGLEAPDEEIVPIQQLLGCPNLPVPPIPSEQLPQSASQPPLESAPQSSSQSASQADSQEDAITPHAQQKDQHAEQRTAAPSVDLDKARSISANESGDLGQQKHDNDSCLDQAEASTVMDALEDPATLEAEAVTLSERANADAPGALSDCSIWLSLLHAKTQMHSAALR